MIGITRRGDIAGGERKGKQCGSESAQSMWESLNDGFARGLGSFN